MDCWMISRSELKNDLMEIFDRLNGLQYQYDWVISDHGNWFFEECPSEVRSRWQWNALLMGGEELTEHLTKPYVSFIWSAVLSAVPKGTKPEQVWDYIPGWEEDFSDPNYQFQTPLTELELVCYDGYAWIIVCKPEFSPKVLQALPQAKTEEEFYKYMRLSGKIIDK